MHLDCFMFDLIFILFNDYNSLSVDQYIFQNQNKSNFKRIKNVNLENVIFINFNTYPLVFFFFYQTSPFFSTKFVITPFHYCRGDRFLSRTCWFLSVTWNYKIPTNNPESKLSLYALPAHFSFFMLFLPLSLSGILF